MKFSLTRRQKIYIAIPLIAAVLLFYAFVNPSETWWTPKCIVHWITGFDCPGCGSQRALHCLLTGDLGGAFGYNAFLVILLPIILLMGISELWPQRFEKFNRMLAHPVVIGLFVAATVFWTVWRNIP